MAPRKAAMVNIIGAIANGKAVNNNLTPVILSRRHEIANFACDINHRRGVINDFICARRIRRATIQTPEKKQSLALSAFSLSGGTQ